MNATHATPRAIHTTPTRLTAPRAGRSASFAALVLAVAAAGGSTPLGQTVDACIESEMAAYAIPGLAVAVVVDGEIAYERGYGVRHRTHGGAVDEHTVFATGSTGKMFTAAAVLRLVDEGRIDLDDPVTEYIPELHFAPGKWTADHITVRHLINQSAAVPSFRSAYDGSLSEWAATLDEVPLFARPGAMWNYSNSNLALAALVVERASGMEYPDYLEAELYAPAGMRDSARDPQDAMASGNYTWGHADDGVVYALDDRFYLNESGSGNSFTSAHDLALWARLMMRECDDVISPRACTDAQSPQMPLLFYGGRPTSLGGGSYGFGLFIDAYPDAPFAWHDGGVPGGVSSLSGIRSEGIAVALLANSWWAAFDGLRQAEACIYESAFGISRPDMRRPGHPSTWSRYVGTYDAIFEDGFEFEAVVKLENGSLMITVPHPDVDGMTITRELENVHGSAFILRPDPTSWWEITFVDAATDTGPTRWIRNLRFVGERRPEVRRVRRRAAP